MKVLITGSTGLLGSALMRTAPKTVSLAGTYNVNTLVPNVPAKYLHVDITKKNMVDEVFKTFKPDVVIHTAAIATPDYCDKHQKEAYSVNVLGTKNIIAACEKYNSAIVFITTNGVYDGKKPPYTETSVAKPVDYYGETKLEGEQLTLNSSAQHIIIRLITLYGWNNPKERQNPVTWQMKILGENKTPINMVNDMFNNFLYSHEAAKAVWAAIKKKKFGEMYNIAGKTCESRYAFAVKIAKTFGMDSKMIYPVPMSFFKNFVERPKNTCFRTTKMQKHLLMKPVASSDGLLHLKKHPLTASAWKQL